MTDLTEMPVFGQRFVLFSDCLLLGVLTFLAALPLVTAFAAVTAACRLLADRVDRDAEVTVTAYGRAFVAVLRSHPGVTLVPALVVFLVAVDALALAAGAPGRPALAVALGVLAVVGLRAAAGWAPGNAWSVVLRSAGADTVRQPGGSALLLAAVAVAIVLAWTVPLMIVLVPGVLALAPIAVGRR
jgi:hypothetical protein